MSPKEITLLDTKLRVYRFGRVEKLHKKTGKWIVADSIEKGRGYKRTEIDGRRFRLHKIIYYAFNPDYDVYSKKEDFVIDHKNMNKLDNRLSNLRLVTQQENSFNRKDVKGYSQGSKNCFLSYINYNRKHYTLGCYKTKEYARAVYIVCKYLILRILKKNRLIKLQNLSSVKTIGEIKMCPIEGCKTKQRKKFGYCYRHIPK